MGSAALDALQNIVNPAYAVWLVAGVLIGTTLGIVPGLGGLVGLSVLLPFIYGMDAIPGLFLLVGIMAVTQTSDSFPAVMFGIPGTSNSQATIMDGHPLAKLGQGDRALGAAFMSSMLGGLIGAAALFLALPVAKPLVLAMRSPELLMLSVIGLTTVAVVARGSMLLGLLSAALGLALASVGTPGTVLEYRYTFGLLGLEDGLSIVVVALALFAIPELLNLLVRDVAVADQSDRSTLRGVLAGAREALRNWGLVLRSSTIGVLIGVIPGVGGSAVNWFTYASASRSRKNRVPFGKGEIRGVIAPESANNAVEGGSFVPTFLFGIPGSATTAVLLGALALMGIQPGPQMVQDDGLDLMLSVIWALAMANVLATGLCIGLARWIANLARVPARALVPFLSVVIVIASYQNRGSWIDISLVFGIGLIGWLMMSLGIPRPPLLIGFVLASPIENYLWISNQHYGTSWLHFPAVLGLGAIALFIVSLGLVRGEVRSKGRWVGGKALLNRIHRGREASPTSRALEDGTAAPVSLPQGLFCVVCVAVFAGMGYEARDFQQLARWFPLSVAYVGCAIAMLGVCGCIWALVRTSQARALAGRVESVPGGATADSGGGLLSAGDVEAVKNFGSGVTWLMGVLLLLVCIQILGTVVGALIWILVWLRLVAKWRWRALALVAGSLVLALWMLSNGLGMSLPA